MTESAPVPRLIRLATVEAMTGLKRSAIYDHISKGEFPAQRRLTARASAWREDEVIAWIESRPAVERRVAQ